jgi:hypothetical protein
MLRRVGPRTTLAALFVMSLACAGPEPAPESSSSPGDFVSLSETRGVRDRHFSARIDVTRNYVQDPVYCVVGTLPAGVALVGAFDSGVVEGRPMAFSNTGLLEGTPRESGIYTLRLRVTDRHKGTHDDPTPFEGHGSCRWYFEDVTIRIYDRLEDE